MIVIRSLVPGGVAEQDGRLKPVDRLMSVNDTNLEHASLSYAVETLKGTPKGEFLFFLLMVNLADTDGVYCWERNLSEDFEVKFPILCMCSVCLFVFFLQMFGCH